MLSRRCQLVSEASLSAQALPALALASNRILPHSSCFQPVGAGAHQTHSIHGQAFDTTEQAGQIDTTYCPGHYRHLSLVIAPRQNVVEYTQKLLVEDLYILSAPENKMDDYDFALARCIISVRTAESPECQVTTQYSSVALLEVTLTR
jgi:hypothetical protein